MTVYIVTGKLGTGKTLASVGRIRDYLMAGRRVATNLDLNLDKMLPLYSKATVTRMPDKPRIQDFQSLGTGDDKPIEEYNEHNFGLLVLDELGSWLNSRSWSDKERPDIYEWFIHARKYHWDLMLLIQDIDALDKQIRSSLTEHLVICRDGTKLFQMIPVVGGLMQAINKRFPGVLKFHFANVYYGESQRAPRVERWWYRARDLYPAYQTGQVFKLDQQFINGEFVDMRATYTLLSRWHLEGRYHPRKSWQQLADEIARQAIKGYAYLITHAAAKCLGRSPRYWAARWGFLTPLAYKAYMAGSMPVIHDWKDGAGHPAPYWHSFNH